MKRNEVQTDLEVPAFNNMSDNILVIMSDNRDITSNIDDCDYNTLCALINYNYCQKNNYGFKYFRPHNNGDFSLYNCYSPSKFLRHSSWAKLLTTIKSINEYEQYDYIVYIDSDCIFNNINLTIQDYYKNLKIVNNGDVNKSNLLFLNDRPWHPKTPCAGYYILKNDNKSLKVIKDWYSLDGEGIEQCNITHPYEQWAVYKMFELTNPEELLIIDDVMFEDSHKEQFLRHIGTHEKNNRIPFFKNKITELSLFDNFNDLVNNLKMEIVEYDTNKIIEEHYG
jgi:hypothetical protein